MWTKPLFSLLLTNVIHIHTRWYVFNFAEANLYAARLEARWQEEWGKQSNSNRVSEWAQKKQHFEEISRYQHPFFSFFFSSSVYNVKVPEGCETSEVCFSDRLREYATPHSGRAAANDFPSISTTCREGTGRAIWWWWWAWWLSYFVSVWGFLLFAPSHKNKRRKESQAELVLCFHWHDFSNHSSRRNAFSCGCVVFLHNVCERRLQGET